ncbi:MAG: hypothetical protein WBQ52_21760, partial [Terracidiphilus sp.]
PKFSAARVKMTIAAKSRRCPRRRSSDVEAPGAESAPDLNDSDCEDGDTAKAGRVCRLFGSGQTTGRN